MLEKIRTYLSAHQLDALLITRTDSFLGEYYPLESDDFRQATGFTGSAGLAVITPDSAVLFVDSRYTEQAKIQSTFRVFEIPTETTVSAWLNQNLPHQKIGYPTMRRPVMWVELMMKKGIELCPAPDYDALFIHPSVALKPTFHYDECYAGKTADEKISSVAKKITDLGLDAYLFTTPDSVSYLLNERSLSVPEYPVVFRRLIVFADGRYQDYDNPETLMGLKVGMDLSMTSQGLFDAVRTVAQVVNTADMAAEMKSQKNPIEQNNIRQACLFESAVMCRFLAWVEENKQTITETDCDEKLRKLRSESLLYRGDSFDTIAAVGEHAARAHYRADDNSNSPVASAPILLVDTGGNYLNGTTDMTRTICIGAPTPMMKKRYTQVLKGHIACATTPVKSGDLPTQMDQRAHSFLRADGVDYGHSTGHGIGMYLAVHEYPPAIFEYAKTPLLPGMLFSNEPAFYDADAGYGIRLENMLMTLAGPDNSLILENLLWVPFDGRLIDFTLLDENEKRWLYDYHNGIKMRIFPALSEHDQKVLQPLLDFFTAIG